MSSIINENGTIPAATTGGAATRIQIASSTNASPIVLTTSNPHTAVNGDTVRVEGHLTNTNANGLWTILAPTTSTITLVGSTGNGIGTASGYVYDYAVNPLLTIPSDGDAATASSINPALGGLFNLAPWLYERTGQYRNYLAAANGFTNTFGASWSTTSVPNTSTWTLLTSTSALLVSFLNYTPVWYKNDILTATITTSQLNNASSPSLVAIGIGISLDGGAATYIPGSGQQVSNQANALSLSLSATIKNVAAFVAQGQKYDFCLMGYSAASGSISLQLQGDMTIIANQWRPNN